MGNITATMVRELRGETGAAMMDCKKALEATSGDVQAAKDHLRKQGLKTAAKKASRETSEGRVFAWVSDDKTTGALVSVSCETDFVARTQDFEDMLLGLAKHVAEHAPADVETLYAQPWAGEEETVEAYIKQVIGKLGENIKVTHAAAYSNPNGIIGSYIHHNDKLGVLVSITADADADKQEAFAKDLGIHIAFHNPPHMSRDEVPVEDVERERAIHRETVANKPAEIQDKIIDGKMGKFYGELVLPEQPWVKDDKSTVTKVLQAQLGADAKIEGFQRYDIG